MLHPTATSTLLRNSLKASEEPLNELTELVHSFKGDKKQLVQRRQETASVYYNYNQQQQTLSSCAVSEERRPLGGQNQNKADDWT